MLGLCENINQGVWSGPVQFGNCQEMTFVVNRRFTNKDLSIDSLIGTYNYSQCVGEMTKTKDTLIEIDTFELSNTDCYIQ